MPRRLMPRDADWAGHTPVDGDHDVTFFMVEEAWERAESRSDLPNRRKKRTTRTVKSEVVVDAGQLFSTLLPSQHAAL